MASIYTLHVGHLEEFELLFLLVLLPQGQFLMTMKRYNKRKNRKRGFVHANDFQEFVVSQVHLPHVKSSQKALQTSRAESCTSLGSENQCR